MKWRVIVLLVILTVIHKVRSHNRRRQIRESFNRQSQVFVVTGGASGIGRHLTGCLLARGHKVVSCDINHEALQASYEESWKPTAGARIIIAKLDVRSPEQWAEALQLGVQTFGSLDVLLNIAGYIHPGAAAEFDLKQLDLHIDINTKVRTPLVLLSLESLTTLLTCVALSFSFLFFSFLWPACHAQGMIIGSQLAAQHMLKQGKGHIVNIASTAGIFFPCGLSLYGASKVSPHFLFFAARHDEGIQFSLLLSSASSTGSAASPAQWPSSLPTKGSLSLVFALTRCRLRCCRSSTPLARQR